MAATAPTISNEPLQQTQQRGAVNRAQPVAIDAGSNQTVTVARSQQAIAAAAPTQTQTVARQQTVTQTTTPSSLAAVRQQAVTQPTTAAVRATAQPSLVNTNAAAAATRSTLSISAPVVDESTDTGIVAPTPTVIPVADAATNTIADQATSASGTTIINQQVIAVTNRPGGTANGDIQFYANGKFAADDDFKYDSETDTLTLTGNLTTGNLSVGQFSNLGYVNRVKVLGGTSGQFLSTNGDGGLQFSNIYSNVNTAAFLESYTGNMTANVVSVSTIRTNTATANIANIDVLSANTANLGAVGNLTITGGSNGQVLTTNGNGSLNWATVSGNGNITINSEITNGTSNVIVNADSNVTFGVAGLPEVLTITNAGAIANLFTSNNYTLGNSTTTISTNKWMDAITTSTNPTVLFSASNAFSSIDVHITTVGDTSKQISKLLSVTQGATTNYSLYGNVTVGNDLANFTMDQTGGNVRVIATSTTANRVDYRLVITLYN